MGATSCMRCEVWKERLAADCAKVVVAGRKAAALRRMREAMVGDVDREVGRSSGQVAVGQIVAVGYGLTSCYELHILLFGLTTMGSLELGSEKVLLELS